MPKSLVISSSTYNSSTRSFNYKFPTAQSFKSKQLALTNIAIYNQFFNISSAYGNNTVTFTFNSATPQTFSWVLSDGYYSISDLNYALQNFMVLNKLYVVASNGNFVYFFQLVVNSVQYSAEMDFAYIPTSAQATTAGYTQPSGATWSYPSTAKTCQITFNSAFGKLIGFTTYTTYPTAISSTSVQLISNQAPTLSVVNCLVLTCNLIRSGGMSYPDNVDNQYNEISIQLLDQNNNVLSLIDTDCNFTLSIKDKTE